MFENDLWGSVGEREFPNLALSANRSPLAGGRDRPTGDCRREAIPTRELPRDLRDGIGARLRTKERESIPKSRNQREAIATRGSSRSAYGGV